MKKRVFLRFLRSLPSLKLQKQKNTFLKNGDFLTPLLTKLELSAVFEMLKIERICKLFSHFSRFLTRDFVFSFFGNPKVKGRVRCKSHFLKSTILFF